MTPATAAIGKGDSQLFTAATLDQFGDPIAATVSWSVDGGGTMSNPTGATSTFNSDGSSTGTFTVTADAGGGVLDTATVTVEPPVLTTITVTPATATIPTGGSRLFTAEPRDQYGDPIAATVNWTVDGGGTMSNPTGATSTFNSDGSSTGTFTVTADAGGGVLDTAEVTVEARVLDSVAVTPRDPEIVVLEDQVFNAVTLDQFGAPIAVTVGWAVSGGGTLSDNTGLTTTFKSDGTLGEFTITATSGTVSGQTTVTVLEELVGLAVGPGCSPETGAGLGLAAAMLAAALATLRSSSLRSTSAYPFCFSWGSGVPIRQTSR